MSRSLATARSGRRSRRCSAAPGIGWRRLSASREIYRLPRAVHLDHEIMRLLQSLGLSEVLADEMVPVDDYRWFGADGELLLRFEPRSPAPSGWESDYMFFQPELERAIDEHACAPAGVTVERGWAAEGLVQSDERVELTLRRVTEDEPGRLALTGDTRTVTARWVVGADGANSFVREASGITRRDLGFQERWLVVDAEPHDMARVRRPAGRKPTLRPGTPDHRRAERPPAPAVGVHAPAPRAGIRFRRSGAGVGATRAVVPAGGRAAHAQRGLRVSLDAGRPDAQRARRCWWAMRLT